MRKLWKGVRLGGLAGVMLLGAFVPARAQDELPPLLRGREKDFSFIGNAGGEFLSIPIGARGVAMGQAFTAAVDDISALWWNPAGLGFMRSPAAFITAVDLPLDVQFTYVGLGAPVLGGNGVVGAAFGMLRTDPLEVTTIEEPLGTGETFKTWSSNTQFSYAHNISDRFMAGGSVKWAHENIYGVTSDAFQFDFGTNYHTTFQGRGIRLAFAVQNLGTNFKSSGARLQAAARPPEFPTFPNSGNLPLEFRTAEFRPPTVLKVALAYHLVESESSTFLVNGEFGAPRANETTYSVGGEWKQALAQPSNGGIGTAVAARVGYTFQQDEQDLGDSPDSKDQLRGLGVGGGLQMDLSVFGASFDYAWRSWGRLGATNNFSVSVLF